MNEVNEMLQQGVDQARDSAQYYVLGAKDSAEAYANQMYEYMLTSERYQQLQAVTFLDIFDFETIRNFNGT